jgi:hypothetical protein
MRSIGAFNPQELIIGWDRGRPVRIEREARTVSCKNGALTERASHAVRTRRPCSQHE